MSFGVDDEAAFHRRRDELVAQFRDWLERTEAASRPEDLSAISNDFDLLLDWKWGYGDGELGRWNGTDLSDFLLGWCPRKVMGPSELTDPIPRHVGLAMRFLGDAKLLQSPSWSAGRLAAEAVRLQPGFRHEMASPKNFGLGKSIFEHTGADLEDLTPDSLHQVMEAFNALPEATRRAVTDAAMPQLTPTMPDAESPDTIGAVLRPSEADVDASARVAPVLASFDILSDYFEPPGKNLTKTGAIKLADAAALAELLGTGETSVTAIGDHTFRKRSARDFGRVDELLTWARESGVLRNYRGKLVAVKSWRNQRRTDPVAVVTRAGCCLLEAGAVAVSSHLYTAVEEEVELAVPAMLARLLQGPSIDFEELRHRTENVLREELVSEYYPGHASDVLDRALTVLETAGIILQSDVTTAPGPRGRETRQGGNIALTAVGATIAVEHFDQMGYDVEFRPPVAEMTADEMVELVDSFASPEQWWSGTTEWLDVQPDADAAVADLLRALHRRSLVLLDVALDGVPVALHDRLRPAVRQLSEPSRSSAPTDDELALASASWLVRRALAEADGYAPELERRSGLMMLGASCEGGVGPEVVEALEEADAGVAEQLIADIARLLPPRSVDLLDAIGHHHSDKRVAKAARKELFRVRSKLAARRA